MRRLGSRTQTPVRAVAMCAFALMLVGAGKPETRLLDCLHGSNQRDAEVDDEEPDCDVDPSPRRDPTIQRVIHELGLDSTKIVFQRCRNRGFSTSERRIGDLISAYVTYPDRDGRGYQTTYVAPLTHELGHVAQIQDAGGMGKLLQLLKLRNVELGADFLAGLALHRAHPSDSVLAYVTNLDLRGDYEIAVDDHGKPLDRTDAFRRGYFRDGLVAHREGAQAAHLAFQLSLYGDDTLQRVDR